MNEEFLAKWLLEILEEFEEQKDFILFEKDYYKDEDLKNCNFELLKTKCLNLGFKIELKENKLIVHSRKLTNI